MNPASGFDREREGWRRRQERMRFELLSMVYRASHAETERRVHAVYFAQSLGVWEEEVWNAFVWLDRAGLVRLHGAGPVVSLTLAGQRYIEQVARRRKTVRGIAPPEEELPP